MLEEDRGTVRLQDVDAAREAVELEEAHGEAASARDDRVAVAD
jgi:hypothetical protein